jgi:replicative DNA helicase
VKAAARGGADESLPLNLELEQEVLGGVLAVNEVYWRVPFLEPRHFSEQIHQAIWEVTGEMLKAGRPATVLTIRSYLPADLPVVEGMSLSQYLARLAGAAAGAVAAEGAAREVHRLAVMRALIATGEDAAFRARRGIGPDGLAALVNTVSAELSDLAEELGAADAGPAQVGYADVVAEAEARMKSGRSSRGVPTGLVALDYKLGGLMPGDLDLLAGRTSMGKTGVALSIARRAAFTGYGVIVHSIEMDASQCKARLLSDECQAAGHIIPYQDIDRKRIEPDHVTYLKLAAGRLDQLPLMIIDRGSRLADVAGHIRAGRKWLKARGFPLSLYILDYLGLVDPGDRYKGNRTNEVGEITAKLKRLAKEEQIPILALHQLSRQNEARKDRRPQLQDLRDSGSLEQDADVVMFVYRDSYYLERHGSDDAAAEVDRQERLHDIKGEMELIVAKQRQGAVGTVKLWCNMATNSVRDSSGY